VIIRAPGYVGRDCLPACPVVGMVSHAETSETFPSSGLFIPEIFDPGMAGLHKRIPFTPAPNSQRDTPLVEDGGVPEDWLAEDFR
jgi:hypothetical protein